MESGKLLVVGARPNSLGMHVHDTALKAGWRANTAGQDDEEYDVDVRDVRDVAGIIKEVQPNCIVCTVGVNTGPTSAIAGDWLSKVTQESKVNYLGPMRLLHEWLKFWLKAAEMTEPLMVPFHFVAISSNSANIARSQSAPYCASKAALTMALRCVAREYAHTELTIYGYEPGWIDGTPQSVDIAKRLHHDEHGELIDAKVAPALHRIPGDRTLDAPSLALLIVSNLKRGRHYLNGCTLRLDGGEQ